MVLFKEISFTINKYQCEQYQPFKTDLDSSHLFSNSETSFINSNEKVNNKYLLIHMNDEYYKYMAMTREIKEILSNYSKSVFL